MNTLSKYLAVAMLFGSLAMAQTATVNLSETKQIIKGFGGISHPIWYRDLNAQERDLAFGNGAGQLGLTVLRIWVSDNSSQWALDTATAKRAISHGAIVFASPWNPPSTMTMTDATGAKSINPSSYGAYANHLNSFIDYMKARGVDLYAISTQNEPDYAHEWTKWTPQQSVDFIKGYGAQIKTRLMTPESFQYRKEVYDPILNDPAALANVDIFGAHLYGTQLSQFPYPLFVQKGAGKELWMTEVYTDSKSDGNIWNLALDAAEHIHNALVVGNFQTYVWWPLRRYYGFIHDGEGGHNSSTVAAAGTATKRGYCMAQFSKFVRPGYVRVGATEKPATNVFVSAYKKDGNVVIVAVNKNSSTSTISMSVPGTQVTQWERYVTSASKNVQKETNITGGATFQVTLEASSVTSLVGLGNAGAPQVAITAPTGTEVLTAPATLNITATASDPDGSIAKVEFYDGTTKLGEDATSPYSYAWTNITAGVHQVKAVATDNAGNKAESVVQIKVNVPQGPYGGTPHAIPGKIELENYDEGGNGVAYFDVDAGTNVDPAPNFRTTEDVDLEVCTDAGAGYNLGWTNAGEWLEYTAQVNTAGLYNITLRVACNGTGRKVSLQSGTTMLAPSITIPNTGGWQVWQNVVVENVQLSAGTQVLRLTIGDSNYVNLNSMTFALQNPVQTLNLNSVQAISVKLHADRIQVSGTPNGSKVQIYDLTGQIVAELGSTGGKLPTKISGPHVLGVIDATGKRIHTQTLQP